MALITTNDMLAKAIDTQDAKLAGRIADRLRANGLNYDEILRLAQAVRPNLTANDWESLMYEADESGED